MSTQSTVIKASNIRPPLAERTEKVKKLLEVSDAKCGEYKGNDLLILKASSRFPFQFGMGKARLIVENIDLIKAWIEAHGE